MQVLPIHALHRRCLNLVYLGTGSGLALNRHETVTLDVV